MNYIKSKEETFRIRLDKKYLICHDCYWKVQGFIKSMVNDAPKSDEYLCPNCVTPWKCNGPHILEEDLHASPCWICGRVNSHDHTTEEWNTAWAEHDLSKTGYGGVYIPQDTSKFEHPSLGVANIAENDTATLDWQDNRPNFGSRYNEPSNYKGIYPEGTK
jgi:hypothetical protein